MAEGPTAFADLLRRYPACRAKPHNSSSVERVVYSASISSFGGSSFPRRDKSRLRQAFIRSTSRRGAANRGGALFSSRGEIPRRLSCGAIVTQPASWPAACALAVDFDFARPRSSAPGRAMRDHAAAPSSPRELEMSGTAGRGEPTPQFLLDRAVCTFDRHCICRGRGEFPPTSPRQGWRTGRFSFLRMISRTVREVGGVKRKSASMPAVRESTGRPLPRERLSGGWGGGGRPTPSSAMRAGYWRGDTTAPGAICTRSVTSAMAALDDRLILKRPPNDEVRSVPHGLEPFCRPTSRPREQTVAVPPFWLPSLLAK